ncbi:RnfABCDGE type electron transport complex subunit D, partial [Candidatus Marithrix sp. Canyon 246]
NAGITITLILLPWVSISPPYQYTENFSGSIDWILPAFFIVFGTFLNARYARRIPLIIAWLIAFAAQAILRAWYFDTPMITELEMMTGVAFLLFTFYMVEDPGSTPFKPLGQVIFGVSVAVAYAIFMMLHIVFGLFFALFSVCIIRGIYMSAKEIRS